VPTGTESGCTDQSLVGPVLSRTLIPSKGMVEGTYQFQPVILIHRAAYLELFDDGVERMTNSSMVYGIRFGIRVVLSRIVDDCSLAECL